jgi:hypothetical protein
MLPGFFGLFMLSWISKEGKQDNINKPKKPGSIEGSHYT